MKKPTLEQVQKAIKEIDKMHIKDIFRAIWQRLIEEGEVPCDICGKGDKQDW